MSNVLKPNYKLELVYKYGLHNFEFCIQLILNSAIDTLLKVCKLVFIYMRKVRQ